MTWDGSRDGNWCGVPPKRTIREAQSLTPHLGPRSPGDTCEEIFRLPISYVHSRLHGLHATPRQGRALLLLDMSAGYEATYTTDRMEPTAMEADYLIPTQEPWTP